MTVFARATSSSSPPSTSKYIGVIEVVQAEYGNRPSRPDKSRKRPDPEGDHVKAYVKPAKSPLAGAQEYRKPRPNVYTVLLVLALAISFWPRRPCG